MEIEIFRRAKDIQEKINDLNTAQFKIEKIKPRPDDEQFNSLRQGYYDSVTHLIHRLQADFKAL